MTDTDNAGRDEAVKAGTAKATKAARAFKAAETSDQIARRNAYLVYETEMLRRRSILKASLFELSASYFIAGLLILSPIMDRPSSTTGDILKELIQSQPFLAGLGIFFFQTLLILLVGRTVLVGLWVFQTEVIRNLVAVMTDKKGKETVEYQIATQGQVSTAYISGSTSYQNFSSTSTSAQASASVLNLTEYLKRSVEAEQRARFRPNVLLFVGSMISFLGVLVFFATSPAPVLPEADRVTRIIDAMPRVFLFLFIQVIAGFFLRQYRTGLEDYRYYEAVLRSRESQHVSLLLRQEANDKEAVAKLADKMLENGDFMKLQKGETTFVLETQKLEKNEVLSLADLILKHADPKPDAPAKRRVKDKPVPSAAETGI